MKNRAKTIGLLLGLSACSPTTLEFNDLSFGISKEEILRQHGEPASITAMAVLQKGGAIDLNELSDDVIPRDVVEIWNYPARRTYNISENRTIIEKGQAELYFSKEGRYPENQLNGYGWVSEKDLERRAGDNDT